MKLAIIIPAYNEEKTIADVIRSIPKKINGITEREVVVVNDGSADKTEAVTEKTGVRVLTHIINLGVGAATVTGLDAARALNADVTITLDADGQHDAKEINKIVGLIIEKNYDVVIGTRLIDREQMPLYKSFGNFFMNWVTFALYGTWFRDSQSGFKGFSKKAIQQMNLSSQGYEICSEMIGEIGRLKLKSYEMPIRTIYTEHSKKRGQYPLNAVNIIIKLIFRSFFK